MPSPCTGHRWNRSLHSPGTTTGAHRPVMASAAAADGKVDLQHACSNLRIDSGSCIKQSVH
eukprot:8194448-Pyramimonas_sp.AAC.1